MYCLVLQAHCNLWSCVVILFLSNIQKQQNSVVYCILSLNWSHLYILLCISHHHHLFCSFCQHFLYLSSAQHFSHSHTHIKTPKRLLTCTPIHSASSIHQKSQPITMYYYPSMYAHMTPASCLSPSTAAFPMQDSKPYFVNQQVGGSSSGSEDIDMGNSGNDSFKLSGQQLSQMKNRQLMNRHYGKRSRVEEHSTTPAAASSMYEDPMMMMTTDNDDYSAGNKRHRRVDLPPNAASNTAARESDSWPTFKHPDGGVLKFTPHGTIRSFFDDAKGVEVSILENPNGCSFGSFP